MINGTSRGVYLFAFLPVYQLPFIILMCFCSCRSFPMFISQQTPLPKPLILCSPGYLSVLLPAISLYLFYDFTVTLSAISLLTSVLPFSVSYLSYLLWIFPTRRGSWFVKSRTEIHWKSGRKCIWKYSHILVEFYRRDLKVEKWLLYRCVIISLSHYFCDWKLGFTG